MAKIRKRDFNIISSIRGEIDLRTKSESKPKSKYNRKEKYKNNYI